ncbi:MAG: heavy metal-associated domain-containing protein [Flavobacteriaceae bacterium]
MNHFIQIQNLKCGGCAKTVIDTLKKIKGLSDITIDLDKNIVSFSLVEASLLETVENKLTEIGYPPVGSKNSVITKAKSFVSCAAGKMSTS